MEKFTINDFISYNSPCFSCDNKISLKMGILGVRAESNSKYSLPALYIRPVFNSDNIDIDLKITYRNVLKLRIFAKDNKFETSNIGDLTDYLSGNNLFFESYCDQCYSTFSSKILRFNFKQDYIYPVELKSEQLVVETKDTIYYIRSDFNTKATAVDIFSLNDGKEKLHFDLPILPLYKFKTKEHFLKKMKTLIIFS